MSKGFLVSATRKSSGKTTISLGLGAALTKRGYTVQPFKKGPDYIDPNWHTRATGRACLNLDFRLQSSSEIQNTFDRYRQEADVVYVEGNIGLFDGMDIEGGDSNAALAKQLNLPVVLVIDCEGMTRGIAPILQGYQHFDDQLQLAGVILNRVASDRHQGKLLASVERYTDLKIFGCIHRQSELSIDERHLGLVPSNEASGADKLIQLAAGLIEDQLDLDAVLEAGHDLPEIQNRHDNTPLQASAPKPAPKPAPKSTQLRLGLARDAAFGFYYQDDLDAFKAHGVEVVEFDTINDQDLPEVDALFLGGGFPETHLGPLAENQSLRQQIYQFIDAGGPAYAECGGLMYLCESIEYQGQTKEMVGILSAKVKMQDRPVGRGYARLTATENHPWGSENLSDFDCHEFHYSLLDEIGPELQFAYRVKRGYGVTGEYDGLIYKNLLANYSHLRHARQNQWVTRFIQFIKKVQA